MLEIDQIVSKCHVDTPTVPLSDEFPVALWFLLDIVGVIHEGTWFYSY